MLQKLETLRMRVITSLGALFILGFIYFYFRTSGLKALSFFTVFFAARELIRILFKPDDSITVKLFFLFLLLTLLVLSVQFFQWSGLFFAFISVLYFSLSLIRFSRFESLNHFFLFQASSILGFFYIGLLPSFSIYLLNLPRGDKWFFMFLSIVFSGDIFAYIFGFLWGRKKLMPTISPKKTIIGALAGLSGSAFVSLLMGEYLIADHFSPVVSIQFFILGLLIGFLGQLGDLFESMMKRVANIKDSGTMLPGHGGVLDRIDGLLFASPLMLLAAIYFENMIIFFQFL